MSEPDKEETTYIITQEQMDAIDEMTNVYAEMMAGLALATLNLKPGSPEGLDAVNHLREIERVLMEVTRTLFPERHAAAQAAKQRAMNQISGMNRLN